MKKRSNLVVPVKTNVNKTGNFQKFTEADLDEVKKYLEHNHESFHFILDWEGESGQTAAVRFDPKDVRLVNLEDIDLKNQYSSHGQDPRKAGKNPQFAEVRHSIHTNGYYLDNIPVVLYYSARIAKYIKITGSTRIEIMQSAGFSNIPAIVFTAIEPIDEDKIENDLSLLGNICNPAARPSAGAEVEDLVKEVTLAIQNGWCERDYESARARVKMQDPTNALKSKHDSIAARAINAHMPGTYLPFPPRSGTRAARDWLHNQKYRTIEPKDGKRGIMYVPYNATFKRKAFAELADIAALNPQYDIRVVIYNPLIATANPEKTFVERMRDWKKFWGSTIAKVSSVYFNNAPARPVISIYGMIPYEISMVETGFDKVIKFEDWDELIDAYLTPNTSDASDDEDDYEE